MHALSRTNSIPFQGGPCGTQEVSTGQCYSSRPWRCILRQFNIQRVYFHEYQVHSNSHDLWPDDKLITEDNSWTPTSSIGVCGLGSRPAYHRSLLLIHTLAASRLMAQVLGFLLPKCKTKTEFPAPGSRNCGPLGTNGLDKDMFTGSFIHCLYVSLFPYN